MNIGQVLISRMSPPSLKIFLLKEIFFVSVATDEAVTIVLIKKTKHCSLVGTICMKMLDNNSEK